MKLLPAISFGALALFSLGASADEIVVSGCAAAGVEANCMILESDGGETYNITAAQPKPDAGTYGTITGTLTDKVSMCQQGAVIDPATWTVDPGKQCPVKTGQ